MLEQHGHLPATTYPSSVQPPPPPAAAPLPPLTPIDTPRILATMPVLHATCAMSELVVLYILSTLTNMSSVYILYHHHHHLTT